MALVERAYYINQSNETVDLPSQVYIIVADISIYDHYPIYKEITAELLDAYFHKCRDREEILKLKNKTKILSIDSTKKSDIRYIRRELYYNYKYCIQNLSEQNLNDILLSSHSIDQWIDINRENFENKITDYRCLFFLYPMEYVDIARIKKYIKCNQYKPYFSFLSLKDYINREVIINDPEFPQLFSRFPELIQLLNEEYYEIANIKKIVCEDYTKYKYVTSPTYKRSLVDIIINDKKDLIVDLLFNYEKIMHLVNQSDKIDATIRNVKRLKHMSSEFSDIGSD